MNKSALVIDDHPLVTRGIAELLYSHCQFVKVTCANSESDLWQYLQQETPSIAIVDFWLPHGTSIPLISQFKQTYPKTPLLVISADCDEAVQTKVLATGANGFISKEEPAETFAKAVNILLKGKNWFKNYTTNSRAVQPSRELVITSEELGLTERQGEVLTMILNGLPNKRIALALSVSEQTVKEHVTGILERLGVRNRIEVITKLRGKKLLPKSYE